MGQVSPRKPRCNSKAKLARLEIALEDGPGHKPLRRCVAEAAGSNAFDRSAEFVRRARSSALRIGSEGRAGGDRVTRLRRASKCGIGGNGPTIRL